MFTGSCSDSHTAIPYRVSTGPEQGFPCVLFPHREKPVYISWDPCNENRFFPVGKSTQGKPCFHYRDGFAVQGNILTSMVKVNVLEEFFLVSRKIPIKITYNFTGCNWFTGNPCYYYFCSVVKWIFKIHCAKQALVVNNKCYVAWSRWFSVEICKYKPGYKSHDLL